VDAQLWVARSISMDFKARHTFLLNRRQAGQK
jgi:hypothetical protein